MAGKSAIGGAISGALGSGVAAGVGGFVTGLATTGDLDVAWEMAKQGAIFGGAIGFAVGGYQGFKAAKAAGDNPWTGEAPEAQVEYPSVGAQGKAVNVKKIDSNYLKRNGLDAHKIKIEYLGKKAPISNYDLYKAPSGQIIILPKDGTGTPIWTEYIL